jgi:hypothetical protein
VPPDFQVNRYFQSFLQSLGTGSFSRGKHRRCVILGTYVSSGAGWLPSPSWPDLLGRPGEEGGF